MKIAIIGSGNIGGSIARGLAQGTMIQASDIICTAVSEATLEKMKAFNPSFILTHDNVEAARQADIILLAVKPWKIEEVIDEIKPALDFKRQIIASVAAGVTFAQLTAYLTKGTDTKPTIFRIMPNTAIAVRSSMTFLSAHNATQEQTELMIRIFNELGNAMLIEEQLMGAGTAVASCGIAFALRYIRAAMEGGVELGFYPKQAQEIVAYTVKGAADLLIASQNNPEVEIDKVTTPGGVTIKGLNAMEAGGFTTAVINGLKASK